MFILISDSSSRIRARAFLDGFTEGGPPNTKNLIRFNAATINNWKIQPGVDVVIIDTYGQDVNLVDEVWKNVFLITIEPPVHFVCWLLLTQQTGNVPISDANVVTIQNARMVVRGSSSGTQNLARD